MNDNEQAEKSHPPHKIQLESRILFTHLQICLQKPQQELNTYKQNTQLVVTYENSSLFTIACVALMMGLNNVGPESITLLKQSL